VDLGGVVYVVVWQYRPLENKEREFRKAYGPDGVWVEFFRKGKGYLGTELLREISGSYITIDRWDSREAYDKFSRQHEEEYRQIDLQCESLTASELKLGDFATERARLQAVNPVLPSRDIRASIDFYVTRLGFSLQFQDSTEEPRYASLRRDDVELHIRWHDPAEWEAVERPALRFVVPDVLSLLEEYKDKGVFHERTAIRETTWDTREFAFFDPDQNGLTFYCDLGEA
jgi:catechol 2,3-dioxygenase-like lactoylglutathione lyase family enzyme/heme-degrading monooxygenase HmoA